jgi:hypothetical protein
MGIIGVLCGNEVVKTVVVVDTLYNLSIFTES